MGSLPLGELQRSLARWIREPETHLAEGPAEPAPRLEDVVRGDSRAPAALRLAVYVEGVPARIRGVLERDLPTLAACLGEDGFHDLVKLYLMACPSRHPSLRFAGAGLPTFLAEHPAADPFRRRWPFAPDLARLEWALVDAFDAPDADVLERRDLEQIQLDAFEELQLFFQPSVSRLSLAWPVQRIVDGPSPAGPPAAPEPTEILVWRQRERARFRVLAPDEARALDAARAGASFGALCTGLAQELGEAAAPPRAAALLAAWLDDALLRPPA